MKCDKMWFNKSIQGMNENITESTVSKEFSLKPYLLVRQYIFPVFYISSLKMLIKIRLAVHCCKNC